MNILAQTLEPHRLRRFCWNLKPELPMWPAFPLTETKHPCFSPVKHHNPMHRRPWGTCTMIKMEEQEDQWQCCCIWQRQPTTRTVGIRCFLRCLAIWLTHWHPWPRTVRTVGTVDTVLHTSFQKVGVNLPPPFETSRNGFHEGITKDTWHWPMGRTATSVWCGIVLRLNSCRTNVLWPEQEKIMHWRLPQKLVTPFFFGRLTQMGERTH